MEFTKPFSEATAEKIDQEIKAKVDALYERTLGVVRERQQEITQIAELLLEKETINVDDVVKLIGERPHEMPQSYKDVISTALNASETSEDPVAVDLDVVDKPSTDDSVVVDLDEVDKKSAAKQASANADKSI